MSFLVRLALVAFTLTTLTRSVEAKSIIAVFDIQDKSSRFSAEELEQLSTYLSAQLASGGDFKIIPRAQIKNAINTEKTKSYEACYDESCQIEIGKELAAEKSVMTQIIAVGSKCAVTTTLYDLKTSASEIAATEKATCEQDAIVTALEHVASRLSSRKTVASTSVTAKPLPVQAPVRTDAGMSTAKILRTAGWIGFGLGYLGAVIGTAATDPYEGQQAAALIPLYGPIRVEEINQENNFSSEGTNGLLAAVQTLGLASLILGYVLDDEPLSQATAEADYTSSIGFGFSSNGVLVGGQF